MGDCIPGVSGQAGDERRRTPRARGSRHEHGRAEHALRGTQCLEGGVKRRRAKGVFAERERGENGVRGADIECLPARLLIVAGFPAGQSGMRIAEAFVSFGFCGCLLF